VRELISISFSKIRDPNHSCNDYECDEKKASGRVHGDLAAEAERVRDTVDDDSHDDQRN
jgi:hypothetical protein